MDFEELKGLKEGELLRLLRDVRSALLGKRGERARERGLAYSSLEEIPGSNGHIHSFETLTSCFSGEPRGFLCRECGVNAYFCPNCGYVPDRYPKKIGLSDIGVIAGSSGDEFYCVVCDGRIGRRIGKEERDEEKA